MTLFDELGILRTKSFFHKDSLEFGYERIKICL